MGFVGQDLMGCIGWMVRGSNKLTFPFLARRVCVNRHDDIRCDRKGRLTMLSRCVATAQGQLMGQVSRLRGLSVIMIFPKD